MSAHPERQFQMGELVKAVSKPGDIVNTVRIGVHRVLRYLAESDSVVIQRQAIGHSQHYLYQWRNT